jgi:hypothetical protein
LLGCLQAVIADFNEIGDFVRAEDSERVGLAILTKGMGYDKAIPSLGLISFSGLPFFVASLTDAAHSTRA